MTNDVTPDDSDRVTAIGFLVKIWEERIFIIATTLFFLLLTEGYILQATPKYTTTILVGHVTSVDNTPGGVSGSSALGGAIALIGLGTGSSNDTKFNLFLTLIKSQNFAQLLETKHHYVGRTIDNKKVSSVDDLRGILGEIIILNEGDTTTLSLQFADKEFAKQFLATVYDEGNQAVRAIDTQRAQKFAAFIEDRFRSENNRPMQDALGSLLVNQERFLMVTSVNLPYAVQLLDGPTSSATPTSPRKTLLQMISFAVGLSMSVFIILIWDAIVAERRRRGLQTPGPSQWLVNTPGQAKRMWQKLTGRSRWAGKTAA